MRRWLAGGAVAVVLPFVMSTSQLSTATFVVIAAIGAVGLNVLTGYTGQISLGHAFFLAAGAYTAAALDGVSAALWLPAAGVVAAACGAVVGPSALRLRGLYLAIVTIGLVFIGQHILFNSPSLSGGPAGRTFPTLADTGALRTIGPLTVDRDGTYYYISLALLGLALVFVGNLARTRTGRAMQAVRDREAAAAVLGVELARTKMSAFVISSFLGGVAGALYAS